MPQPKSEFESLAEQERSQGLVAEMWSFLRHNKKWWLAPIVLALAGVGLLVVLSSSAAAPFIYTLF